jgi:hypothetical protein
VCHKLVRTSLRGDMRIESQPGNGTQVYFSGRFTALPGEEAEEAASIGDAAADAVKRVEFNRRREYEDEDDDLRGLRILAVDDSEVFISIIFIIYYLLFIIYYLLLELIRMTRNNYFIFIFCRGCVRSSRRS